MRRGLKPGVRVRALAITLVAVGLLALPAAGAEPVGDQFAAGLLGRLSQAVQVHFYSAHPEAAPEGLKASLAKLKEQGAHHARLARTSLSSFNFDDTGLPQNEESVGVCHTNTNYVLGGTNDYRGLLDPVGNFTGWHFSTDGGKTLANEGLLPELSIDGTVVPSGGDPVDVAASGCSFYAADLNYTLGSDFNTEPNGIGVYRSDAATLATCDPANKASCWPTGKVVASTNVHGQPNPPSPEHPADFYDKPWMDVGPSGTAGEVVWVVFADFHQTGPGTDTADFTASLKALRCNAALTSCTTPQTLSGSDDDIQFGDVTIGPDGRTYITWAQIIGELPGADGSPSQPQTFVIKSRVAPAGSTEFGPVHIVRTLELPIPFDGTLQANSFRIATYPKNAAAQLPSSGRRGSTPGATRFFVTWEECTARLLDTICEEPSIMLTYSDDQGATWSDAQTLSHGGVNYFPTISADPRSGQVAVAWFTNRYDPFDNRQDVELLSFPADQVSTNHLRRLTPVSNDPEADPLLGSRFIGDYIEVFAFDRAAWVHFNANYRDAPLLFDGVPVNQQDNFLIRTGL